MPSFDTIRPDLWNAVLDYSSGKLYVWDGQSAIVAANEQDPRPRLPTIAGDDFQRWKSDFAARYRADPTLEPRVASWSANNLPTAALPKQLRGPWNAALKQHVRERLERWFAERESENRPADLVVPSAQETPSDSPEQHRLEVVRALMAECVYGMSWKELSELKIPATALARLEGILRGNTHLDVSRSGSQESWPKQRPPKYPR